MRNRLDSEFINNLKMIKKYCREHKKNDCESCVLKSKCYTKFDSENFEEMIRKFIKELERK